MLLVVIMVRGYFANHRVLFQRSWSEDGDRSRWRQGSLDLARDGVGISVIVQSFDRYETPAYSGLTHRQAIESIVKDEPMHLRLASKPYDFHYDGEEVRLFGFGWGGFSNPDTPDHDQPRNYGWTLLVPHWALLLVFIPTAALMLRGWYRRHWTLIAGHCPRCAYDRRATPERCPECGTTEPAL